MMAPEPRRQFADSDDVCRYVAGLSGGRVLLSFSGGKDAVGAYLQLRRHFADIRLLEVATGRWETLAKGVLHFANWSRDSQFVFFESWGEDMAVIRIRIQDRQREKLGTLKEFRRTIGPERCWSGLTPDNSLLVLRDVGSQEVYALSLAR